MKMFYLIDLCDDDVDGIIISETSTKENIQIAIDSVKQKFEGDWEWEDILEGLPEDCTVYSSWEGEVEKVYY